MEKLRTGDVVKVMRGKDRGKTGKVLAIISDESRVVVDKVNRVKRSLKKTKDHPTGGIVEKEAPISKTSVMVVCPSCKKVTRVRIKIVGNEKVRVCMHCGKGIVFK